jgi:hypothetical protein
MPSHSITDELHAMSQLAGVIFAGQVVAVRRIDGGNDSTGVVEIQFAVEDAVRGVNSSIYTLREWTGLWPAGEEPFRVGQRFLMLLYTPGMAGLSSPVGGMDGAIPIRGSMQTQAPGPAETDSARTVAANTSSAGGISASQEIRTADLRWVGTRVVQPLTYITEQGSHPMAELNSVLADVVTSDTSSAAPVSASQATAYGTVMGMLRGWEKADHATR